MDGLVSGAFEAVLSDRPVLNWIVNMYNVINGYGAGFSAYTPILCRHNCEELPVFPWSSLVVVTDVTLHLSLIASLRNLFLFLPLPPHAVSPPLADDPQAFAFRANDELRHVINPQIIRMRVWKRAPPHCTGKSLSRILCGGGLLSQLRFVFRACILNCFSALDTSNRSGAGYCDSYHSHEKVSASTVRAGGPAIGGF